MSGPERPPDLPSFGPRVQLALAVALALAVRFGLAAATPCIHSDGPEYVKVARAYHEGRWEEGLRHPYHPLYPVLLAAAHRGTGEWEWAGMAVSALLSGLAAAPLFLLARRSFGEAAAFPAALFYALHPYVQLSVEVVTTGTYLFFVLACMDLADRARRGAGPWATGLAGVCAGLGYLTRPDGLVLFPAVAISVGWGIRDLRRGWRHAAVLALAFLLTAGPYLGWLRVATGAWVPTGKMRPTQLVISQAPAEDPAATGERAERQADLRSTSAAWQALAGIGRTTWETARALHVPGLFFVAGLVFWWKERRTQPAPGNGALLVFPLLFLAALFWFSAVSGRESKRYTVPIATMTLAWAGAGLAGIGAHLGGSGPRRLRVLAGVTAAVLCVWALRVPGADKRGERLAGEWIRGHHRSPGARVLGRSDRVPFYADGEYLAIVSTRALTAEELLARLDAERADYFVADWHLAEIFPGFEAWMEKSGKHRLQLLYTVARPASRGGGEVLRVFGVLPP